VLGAGGFGITYLAFDHHLDGPVVLKEYFPAGFAARGDDLRVVPHLHGGEEQKPLDSRLKMSGMTEGEMSRMTEGRKGSHFYLLVRRPQACMVHSF